MLRISIGIYGRTRGSILDICLGSKGIDDGKGLDLDSSMCGTECAGCGAVRYDLLKEVEDEWVKRHIIV